MLGIKTRTVFKSELNGLQENVHVISLFTVFLLPLNMYWYLQPDVAIQTIMLTYNYESGTNTKIENVY